uniref:Transcription factor CP2-like n=1 Tax=Saccoglossus kowalevskii TaxID=10224 RepID=A0ABM0M5C9_SACKO|nr:PREDICTED: transcription factor CP2-like [Saccoglossus kowalevskii]
MAAAFNMEDLDGGLAADFDSNLTGLGAELGTAAYNMSEVLAVFKQEEEEEGGFQYILCAATSPAVKLSEEALTYLNQGQSYELKVKKLGNTHAYQGKLLKMSPYLMECYSFMCYIFVDVPLSYGMLQFTRSPSALNAVEFIWDPTKESTGVFIQVHCISTEFTAKKHGGEKGVPFRIQVDTLLHSGDTDTHIHSGSCQIKVFKPKGADRKHKTDREKMEKRSDRDKYQPSYEYTVLTSCSLQPPLAESPRYDPTDSFNSSYDASVGSTASTPKAVDASVVVVDDVDSGGLTEPLSPDATILQTSEWLQRNRFGAYRKLFQNFAGGDLLRLNRDDLIQILGPADGIRLNNALQERTFYHAIYLDHPTAEEMRSKVSILYNVPVTKISHIVRQAPSGIRMIQNIQDESSFSIEALKGKSDNYNV